jgi:tetratricopeptide (TPR) repeat protein
LYDKALSIDPNDTLALGNKGIALSDLGQYDQAIQLFDKVLSIDPNDVDTIYNKAYVLGIGLNNYDEALKLLEENLKTYPNHKGLLCLTSDIYHETGLQGLANHYQERLLSLDQNYQCELIRKASVEEATFL